MKQTTVALLFGGKSNEYEVSCRSAATVLGALRAGGYRVLPIGITREGHFYLCRTTPDRIAAAMWEDTPDLMPIWFGSDGTFLTGGGRTYTPDVVFPVLHGQYGEDGLIQGFLDTWGIPYVGCGCVSSALSWNKVYAKHAARAVGVPTLPWVETTCHDAVETILSQLHFPIFIKPVASGSSVGAGRADDLHTLRHLLDAAAEVDTHILAEPCFVGRELEVAVLSDGDGTIVSRVGEVEANAVFYDYDTKYRGVTARTYLPARITDAMQEIIRDYALRLFRTLGCRQIARIDFFADEEQIFFNEINTMPGFTSISMYPMLLADSGVPLHTLVARLVEGARI